MFIYLYKQVHNKWSGCLLTNTGVPPEDVPVKDVEGEMSETTWNLTVEIFPVKRTGWGAQTEQNWH